MFHRSPPQRFHSEKMENSTGYSMDYSKYMNEVGKSRHPAVLRVMESMYIGIPEGCVEFAAGKVDPEIFPFESISVKLKDGNSFCLEGNDLMNAVQYQNSAGYPPLRKQLKEMVRHFHKPPYDAETILISGHQDGVCKTLEMMLEKGKSVFVADPTYASGIEMMRPYQPAYYTIREDADGIIPELLIEALERSKKDCGGDPKKMGNLLYIVPNGSNPSGTVIPTKRKKEIYKIACDYDLLILEDDPYFFHNYQEEDSISFLSLDTERRVIRIEGLSKLMTPGFRIGMATGPLPIIEKMEWHMQVSVGHLSSISMMVIHKTLEKWGLEGFNKQVAYVREVYRKRRDLALASAEKYLKGLVKYNIPRAGMFIWMEVIGVEDILDMVLKRAAPKGVMVVPGLTFFVPREGQDPPKNCFRLSYSYVKMEDIDRSHSSPPLDIDIQEPMRMIKVSKCDYPRSIASASESRHYEYRNRYIVDFCNDAILSSSDHLFSPFDDLSCKSKGKLVIALDNVPSEARVDGEKLSVHRDGKSQRDWQFCKQRHRHEVTIGRTQ
ncbi:hypothetical protein J437_LFUL005860 [Ladona fulva]|uniref:Aminotransferase class I/classII large domain-containing protein n=1 Tax=Ladona fulva TaxID=123851 RepID=A0A8K0K7B1_LADFU|nr:hypothetical protein J437_LFUL005860 [Ladona fulva]